MTDKGTDRRGYPAVDMEALRATAIALLAETGEGAMSKPPYWYGVWYWRLAEATDPASLVALVDEGDRYKLANYAAVWDQMAGQSLDEEDANRPPGAGQVDADPGAGQVDADPDAGQASAEPSAGQAPAAPGAGQTPRGSRKRNKQGASHGD